VRAGNQVMGAAPNAAGLPGADRLRRMRGCEGDGSRQGGPDGAALVHGDVAPGYEPVSEQFEKNFTARGEVGAAFAAMRDGQMVADLWGGVADQTTGRPWERDTLQLIFSGTKGLVALCLLMLVDRGQLDPEAPVCRYWPEFAEHGKGNVRVAELASHRARLPAVRTPLSESDLTDNERMAALLAAQPQEADPRAAFIYHALTYGWLCGELVRRIDGRAVGRFFAEEVAEPLGLELWIGLPQDLEGRVSKLHYGEGWGVTRNPYDPDDALLVSVWENPPLFPPGKLPWNTRAFHAAEIPGAGAIGTARAVARLYGCLARGGELDGVRLLREETLRRGRACLSKGRDPATGDPLAFGFGFQLQTDDHVYGPPADAFGHTGAGGSVHAAWPSQRMGVSYCMNEMRDAVVPDPRAQALVRAVYVCACER
jgi:CubicO group peptidase (beta-lactamase class C family)